MSQAKPTILSSPFFRSEILNSLTRDALSTPAFPNAALSSLIERLSLKSGQAKTAPSELPTLTPDERAATIKAIQALSAQLAYIENAETHKDPLPGLAQGSSGQPQTANPDPAVASADTELERLALRLHAGLCALLLTDTVRARASLDLVATALRPPRRARKDDTAMRKSIASFDAASRSNDSVVLERKITMRRLALRGVALVCEREGKADEAKRYLRWADDGNT